MISQVEVRQARPAVACGLTAGAVVAVLWAVFVRHSPDALDRRVYRDLHGTAGSGSARFADHLTAIGDGVPLLITLGLLGIVAFVVLHSWRPLANSAAAVVLAAAASTVVKALAGRARPPRAGWLTPDANGNSFPSGHTTVATAGYLGLVLGIAVLLRSPWTRWLVLTAGALMAVAIGWTRIELGVHWPSDVLAGWTIGLAAAAAVYVLLPRLDGPIIPPA
jgi:undecaprenyl-diphosphatase